ncbi:pullulanase [Cohnella yongneupensis]|uniref:pullulanase n=1 Tax=Cohnella yongneupensis TaxID=425006 RepID=A0ABW0R1H4_9BACL
MRFAYQSKRVIAVFMACAMILSYFGMVQTTVNAAAPSKVVLVGDLQQALGHTGNWDPSADATALTDIGNGYYQFTGSLPAGSYEYKVALNGNWDVSYGNDSYTKPGKASDNGNVKLTLAEASVVTFYYNDATHAIADSTYYHPIAANKLPRIVGNLQTEIGDDADWEPSKANVFLSDDNFDNIYSKTVNVPTGNYEYKIVLGNAWSDANYPSSNNSLSLPQPLPVTFTYDAVSHAVAANFTVPDEPDPDQGTPVPDGHLRVHYNRTAGDYAGLGLWMWNDVAAPSANWPTGALALPDGQTDSYGAFVDIPLIAGAKKVGFLVVNRTSGDKDGGDKIVTLSGPSMNEVWIKQGSNDVWPYEPVDLPANTVRIHYTRGDHNYGAFGLWLWDDVSSPSANWPSGAMPFDPGHVDSYGGYVDVPLIAGAKKIGFLVVNRTSGVKDGDNKAFTLLDRYNQLWINQSDNSVYVSPYGEVAIGLQSAEVLSASKLLLNFTLTDGLDAATLKDALTLKDKDATPIAVDSVQITGPTTVQVNANIDLNKVPLSVTYAGKTVSAGTGWRMLDEVYGYDGNDLGATYNAGDVDFKLWAPTATSVVMGVYDKADPTVLVDTFSLTKGDQGVWSVHVTASDAGVADLEGYYYQYAVTNNGVTKAVLDPYAKSMATFRVNTKGEVGPDGDAVGKAAIVDLSGTNPADYGFADIDGYTKREDAIVYETHIRDFTSDPSVEGDLNARWGSYSAFKDKLGYIKSLGVTHVQLLPVMAWYYGDETLAGNRELDYSAQDNEYNWGYDPQSYFSPDGAYSENPADAELRIKELKDLIDAIHEAGMGVVLDVVYTHMAKSDFLNDIVPNYYAFQDANGSFIGGFGNNLATNHKMAEKLMTDSVKYWFNEYKIDGMRWDMMGDATNEAVQDAYNAAAQINPNALFIGEGWRTFGGAAADPALAGHGADQDWMDNTDDVGVFSDEIRNELKSGFGSEGEPRFITGGARSIETILNNIKGQPSNTPADDPGDMVQYIEAHDNLPLYDVIAQSIKKDPSIAANDLEIHQRMRLGNLLILTSQGTAFLHSGQEYGRTQQWHGAGVPEQKYTILKDASDNPFGYFINDAYDSSDAINKFDWAKATDGNAYPVNQVTREYTTGLAELRRSTDAFRLGDKALVDTNVTLVPGTGIAANDLAIAYENKATDGTGNYYVFFNGANASRTLTLTEDLTSGTVVVDNDEAGTTEVGSRSGFTLTANSIRLQPLTAVIIKMEAAAPVFASVELDSAGYNLQIGTEHQTQAYAEYSDGSRRTATKLATYTSNKPSVATVTADGKVRAISAGTAKITVSYNGMTAIATVTVTAEEVKRIVQFNYIRPDGNYADWNLWVWNTGVKNDQINFEKVENGVATVNIEIAPGTTGVGFVLRKGTNWDTAKQDVPDDRVIPIAPGVDFTKVNVNSMVRELDILPSIGGPLLQDGNLTFYYRDDSLFRQGKMNTLTGVKVKIGDAEYPMAYDASKELFSYTLNNLAGGTYEYTFLVTQGGTTEEVTDPKNTVDDKSIVIYRKPTVAITSTLQPSAISSNENGVLKLQAAPSEPVAFTSGYMDLTALGGSAKVPFDTELMAQSISVKDTVPAGAKNVPVTLVDEYGNKHTHTATVNVKARTSVGNLDFDWDEARIYFALTDRFQDGDLTNDEGVDKTHLEAYHGGDFKGMIDKLDYLKELGINTLWISPIVDNIDFNKGVDFGGTQYAYHGYWAKDFTQLDEHLGDLATFKELIDKAHDHGIKIMVDVVLNHTGYGLKPDDAARPGITQADKDRFAGMLRTDGVQADVDPIKGELAQLPDLKTEDPSVREQVIDWQAGWLERARTTRGDTIDYFRVDTVKHVDGTTWKAFKNALTAIAPSFKLIGEYFGGTIDNNGGQLRSGQMDSLLDFEFKNRARDFANGSIDAVDAYLADRETKMDNTATMGQFLSSHDENGFLTHYVGGDKGKLKIAAALQITAKGQPVIYYGEELGRSGANAGDMAAGQFSENRGDMPWDMLTEEKTLHDHYAKLLNIRAKFSKVYAKGERTKLAGSDALGYLAFNKHYGSENVVTIINAKTEAKSVTIPVPFVAGSQVKDEYGGTTYTVSASGEVTVSLPGMNDGGTVILSGVPVTSGGVAPSDSKQIIIASDLTHAKDGKVEIQLPAGTEKITLPIQSGQLLGTNNLQLKAGNVTVTLPSQVLANLQASLPAGTGAGATITFEIKPLTADRTNAIVDNLNTGNAGVNPVSQAYEFKLSVVTQDGRSTPMTTFTEPIVLTFQVNDNANKDALGVYYLGEDGTLEYVGGTLNGNTMTAKVYHFSTYAVLEFDKSYGDVGASYWAYAAIKSLSAKHIINGVSDTRFAPDRTITRAEFAAMLVRALGVKTESTATPFADVDSNKWYAAYVATANRLGLIKGRKEKSFAPEETISREEMAVMLVRALAVKNGKEVPMASEGAAFSDRTGISGWALQSVDTAAALGLVHGNGKGAFAPQGKLTRAESAQVVYQLLNQ